ncbi:MAG: hypothetical protein ABJG78_05460 [Cyclobacteriaceae bacterium]
MKIKYYLPVLSIIFLAACSDENSTDPKSSAAEINAIAGELNDDVVTLVKSDGVKGARTLIDLIDNSTQFGRVSPYQMDENRALITNQIGQISYSFTTGIARLLNEEPADFAENKGVYVWNFNLEDFEKVEASEFIVIAFPTEGSTTNNAEFRLTEFTVIEIDGEELPTTIKADLTIDDDPLVDEDPIIDLDFVVNYSADGNPEAADIYLVAVPFALDITFDDSEASTTSLAVTLLLNSENLVGVDVDVEFDSEAKLEPKSISGEVSYRTLRIVGSVSDDQMDNSQDGDPNDYIDLALFVGEDKAGDIVFVFEEIVEDGETYEDYVPYVEYADGSKDKLEEILEPVIDEIEELLEDFE